MQRVASPLDGCGGFEATQELMLIHQLGPGEPSATYGKGDYWEI